MLSRNQSQRHKGIKVKLGIRTWLALAVCVWMIYQLRVFLNHKLSSENGLSVEDDDHSEKLKLGRKGLLVMGSEVRKIDEREGRADAMEEVKGKNIQENQQEMENKEEVGKGGDFDDEELDSVRFDDPMDEIDSLNDDDDDDDDEVDDNASTDQHSEEEDDSPLERKNKGKVAVATKISEVKSGY